MNGHGKKQEPKIPARLKRRADFLRVARLGQKIATPGMVVQAWNRPGAAGAAGLRVGFTVTRKVGGAVVRNRVRRRLKAAVGEVVSGAMTPGIDLVVIGRAGTAARNFTSLVKDLQKALKRLGVYGP